MAQFSKLSFDATKPVEVIFHGEKAVDGGGPSRECFRLLCAELITNSGLFVPAASNPVATSATDATSDTSDINSTVCKSHVFSQYIKLLVFLFSYGIRGKR